MATGHSSAGVAYQHDADIIMMQMAPKSKKFKKAYEAGRAIHCAVAVDKNNSSSCFSAYGRAGGQ